MSAGDRALDVAWAAGLIDGEGWIGWYCTRRSTGAGAWSVRVQMGERGAIDKLARIFPQSTVTTQTRPAPRGMYWMWRCRTEAVRTVLAELLPFLTVKRTRALQALASGDVHEREAAVLS